MLTTLLSSQEGVRLLSMEDEFLPQIRDSFAQLDPVLAIPCQLFRVKLMLSLQFNGSNHTDPILSKRRIAETLTYGYLEMLGTLSKHKEGIECVLHLFLYILFILANGVGVAPPTDYWRNSRSSPPSIT